MKKLIVKHAPVLSLLAFVSASSHAELIAYDLLNLQNGESSYQLNYYSNDVQALFESSEDGFGVYQNQPGFHNPIPNSLIDSTLDGLLDNYGLIMPTEDFLFFGVTDTANSSYPQGAASAEWGFNVSNFAELSVSIDFAAMGDFETSDQYQIDYALDNSAYQPLFEFKTETVQAMNYTMANGIQRMLSDPLSVSPADSAFRFNLTNNFTTFTSLVSDTGNELKLRLTSYADGGTEGFGLSNIQVYGVNLNDNQEKVNQVPEPSSIWLLTASGLALLSRRKLA